MATIRPATTNQPFTPHSLVNPKYVLNTENIKLLGILPDRVTFIGGDKWGNLVRSSDHTTTWTIVHSFSEGSIEGFLLLPNGEAVVTSKRGGAEGHVYRSTGWAADQSTAMWSHVLTTSGSDTYARGEWSLSAAPTGSTQEGLVVANEYGPHTNTTEDHQKKAIRLWASFDYGMTWAEKFNLANATNNTANQHMHSCAYDPWADRVWAVYGDGHGGLGAKSAIIYTDNIEDASPTWNILPTPSNQPTTNFYQVTTIHPMEKCVVFLTDGHPAAVYRIARLSKKRFGRMQQAIELGSGTGSTWLGHYASSSTVPGGPTFFCSVCNKPTGDSVHLGIQATLDGVNFFDIYRDAAAAATDYSGYVSCFGPSLVGKVVAQSFDGRHTNGSFMIADYMVNF